MAKKMKKFYERCITNLVGSIIRNETLEGREYIVVPMIMIVEGVLNGSQGPLLYPAEELEKLPQIWNHKPVVVYHPQMNGRSLSACDPEVIENYKVGLIMNTSFDGKRLKAEAWLEPSRLKKIDNRVMEALDKGIMMEVSTGLFTENELVSGEFNGVPYDAIARNYRPDHLAILPDLIGACSIEDGAGLLRVNSENKGDILFILNRLGINSDLSHDEIRSQLYTLIRKNQSENEFDFWIEEVYDDRFIYEKKGRLYKQNYNVKEEVANLEGLPVEVERKISYEEVKVISNQKGEEKMDKQKIVNDLISNGKWTEEDREWLMGLTDNQLAKMQTVKNETVEEVVKKEKSATEPKANKQTEEVASVKKEVTEVNVENYLNNAPPEIQDFLGDALTLHSEQKKELIGKITANKKNIFTVEQLSKKSIGELKAIAILAHNEEVKVPKFNFGGLAPVGNTVEEVIEEAPLPLPTMNFKKE